VSLHSADIQPLLCLTMPTPPIDHCLSYHCRSLCTEAAMGPVREIAMKQGELPSWAALSLSWPFGSWVSDSRLRTFYSLCNLYWPDQCLSLVEKHCIIDDKYPHCTQAIYAAFKPVMCLPSAGLTSKTPSMQSPPPSPPQIYSVTLTGMAHLEVSDVWFEIAITAI
jgi:hypothetical protein